MDLVQLETLCLDLTVAARALKDLCDGSGNSSPSNGSDSAKLSLSISASPKALEHEIAVARSNLCGIATRFQTLLAGPNCFIRRMATQNQLLACLKWLGEYQVIAYIPLSDSISLEELAELADVPEHTLSRVVRMTATAGFLHEPQLGYIAHTPLSISFTNELLYFDATMFLANKIAPYALEMTQLLSKQDNMGSETTGTQSPSFLPHLAQESQLSRQWLAYQQSVGNTNNDLGALLNLLNWQSLGEALVVHICDRYTTSSQSLVHVSQGLRLIVQTYENSGADSPLAMHRASGFDVADQRITIKRRKPTAIQPVKDAAVYILQPSFSAPSTDAYSPHELLALELQSHFKILQGNTSALLILAPTMLPEPGSVAVNLEVQARLLDFAEMQLNSKSAVEVTELFKLTESICDAHGKLIVTNRIRSADGATMALAVKFQSSVERNELI